MKNNTQITVKINGKSHQTTWVEFKSDNTDNDELHLIQSALENNKTFHGGGGGFAEYEVKRSK